MTVRELRNILSKIDNQERYIAIEEIEEIIENTLHCLECGCVVDDNSGGWCAKCEKKLGL